MNGSFLQGDPRQRTWQLVSNRWFYHSVFWLVVWLGVAWIETRVTPISFAANLWSTLVNILVFPGLVYFNFLYLIPQYLNRKKFTTYFGLLILTVLIITPLRAFLLYFNLADSPNAQQEVLRNLNYFFIPSFMVAGASTLFKIVSDWVKQQRDLQELETQTMQSELRFLKSQINPHFLFNTLNNLYALTLKKDEKAPEIVVKLSEMMRYMLYECNEKRVPLRKEINYLRNYLDLEKLRQNDRVTINFAVEGRVGSQEIAPLLFIPFLENSFKHGLNHTIKEGHVNIFLQVEPERVHFFIENSKAPAMPRPLQAGKRSGGIGLVNVRRRLDILYPERYTLTIDDQPSAYGVSLEVAL